ncbi:hypothetical protein Kpol_1048p0 [Vanderwaltozyma polyspora DSM 70294]|uniref:Uncharacterized protein n=1 Tax=Vanderwaltozyma polyspora (strain ATCC 22028 / DSM 70294 / BCRC 21397 / CBS 2163 / NBRC 10782 / NRRL Y-8283 / UCD 57-17) TaxID=436907 RepID=A7TGG3_VANPO|nr:uncharacterized protein Kpol_1048p0 [Vanderwaltozyma polyspora DSM 70294]EDO18570.1 hypothetical protein Kpol_1048p0 [Vanderwaltozyma polyspora DSM 70294]
MGLFSMKQSFVNEKSSFPVKTIIKSILLFVLVSTIVKTLLNNRYTLLTTLFPEKFYGRVQEYGNPDVISQVNYDVDDLNPVSPIRVIIFASALMLLSVPFML